MMPTIENSDGLGAILKTRAMAEGISMEQYVVKILERHLAETRTDNERHHGYDGPGRASPRRLKYPFR